MNTNGNPETLIAAHPGNANAAKYGVYSPRMIEDRAAAVVAALVESFEFSFAQRSPSSSSPAVSRFSMRSIAI